MLFILVIIFTILIFIVSVSCVVFRDIKNQNKNKKESFQNGGGEEEATKKAEHDLMDYSGTESCDYLRTENNQMEQKTIDTMHAVLNGFRLNKWKPTTDTDNKNKNKKYCYLYDDKENHMKDIMMDSVPGGCDGFKNYEIVSDAFTTNHVDRTHTIPIQKCVLEIDPTKLVDSNLNAFWDSWNHNRCEYLTTKYKHDIREEQDVLNALKKEYGILSNNNMSYDALLADLKRNEALCLNSNANLTTSIEELHDTNESLLNVLSDKLKVQYDLSDRYDVSKDKRKVEEETLDKETRLCDVWTRSNAVCDDKYKECERKKYLMNDYLTSERAMYDTNTSNNRELMTECNVIFDKYNSITGPYEKCEVDLGFAKEERDKMKEALTREKGVYDTCVVERELLDKQYEAQLHLYERMKKDEERCIRERKQAREDKKACGITNQKCETLRAEEDRIKKELTALENKLRECENSRLENLKTIKKSEEINVALYNDLESLLQSTYKLEKDVYNNENKQNADLSTKMLHSYRQGIKDLTKHRLANMDCGNKKASVAQVNDMENENSYLEYQINMLSNQNCAYCIPTVAQCNKLFHDNDALCSPTPWPSGSTVTSYKKKNK